MAHGSPRPPGAEAHASDESGKRGLEGGPFSSRARRAVSFHRPAFRCARPLWSPPRTGKAVSALGPFIPSRVPLPATPASPGLTARWWKCRECNHRVAGERGFQAGRRTVAPPGSCTGSARVPGGATNGLRGCELHSILSKGHTAASDFSLEQRGTPHRPKAPRRLNSMVRGWRWFRGAEGNRAGGRQSGRTEPLTSGI